MPARAINSATITFGLVSLPVKVYTSARSGKVSFNMMSREGNRIKTKLFDSITDEEVQRADTIKGYEYAKGKYVLFSQDEYNSLLDMNTSRTIDIVEFINKDQIPPVSYQKTYYLGPDKGVHRGYGLLADTMLEQSVVAIAQWSNKGRDHLVVISPYKTDGLYGLLLQQIYYSSEVQSFADIGIASTDAQEAEKDMAKKLVSMLKNEKYDPNKYTDKCTERVNEAVQKKVAGEDIPSLIPAPKVTMVDLMEQLKQSLDSQIRTACNINQ